MSFSIPSWVFDYWYVWFPSILLIIFWNFLGEVTISTAFYIMTWYGFILLLGNQEMLRGAVRSPQFITNAGDLHISSFKPAIPTSNYRIIFKSIWWPFPLDYKKDKVFVIRKDFFRLVGDNKLSTAFTVRCNFDDFDYEVRKTLFTHGLHSAKEYYIGEMPFEMYIRNPHLAEIIAEKGIANNMTSKFEMYAENKQGLNDDLLDWMHRLTGGNQKSLISINKRFKENKGGEE